MFLNVTKKAEKKLKISISLCIHLSSKNNLLGRHQLFIIIFTHLIELHILINIKGQYEKKKTLTTAKTIYIFFQFFVQFFNGVTSVLLFIARVLPTLTHLLCNFFIVKLNKHKRIRFPAPQPVADFLERMFNILLEKNNRKILMIIFIEYFYAKNLLFA